MNNIISKLISRMKLNSADHSDSNFDTCIKFAVEKYIENSVPEQIQCTNFHDAIIQAYKLFLSGNLHSIGIYDHNGYYNGSDALNMFTNDLNKFDEIRTTRLQSCEVQNKIAELETENKILLDFIKLNHAENSYLDYKKNLSKQ